MSKEKKVKTIKKDSEPETWEQTFKRESMELIGHFKDLEKLFLEQELDSLSDKAFLKKLRQTLEASKIAIHEALEGYAMAVKYIKIREKEENRELIGELWTAQKKQ